MTMTFHMQLHVGSELTEAGIIKIVAATRDAVARTLTVDKGNIGIQVMNPQRTFGNRLPSTEGGARRLSDTASQQNNTVVLQVEAQSLSFGTRALLMHDGFHEILAGELRKAFAVRGLVFFSSKVGRASMPLQGNSTAEADSRKRGPDSTTPSTPESQDIGQTTTTLALAMGALGTAFCVGSAVVVGISTWNRNSDPEGAGDNSPLRCKAAAWCRFGVDRFRLPPPVAPDHVADLGRRDTGLVAQSPAKPAKPAWSAEANSELFSDDASTRPPSGTSMEFSQPSALRRCAQEQAPAPQILAPHVASPLSARFMTGLSMQAQGVNAVWERGDQQVADNSTSVRNGTTASVAHGRHHPRTHVQ